MNSPSDIAMNMPNNSLMYSTYTPIFGNLMFQIQPSQTGEVSNTFGTVPYMSLEGLLYMQQISAQTAPTTILPGQNTGQQSVQGTLTTAPDASGNTRVAISGGSSSSVGSF